MATEMIPTAQADLRPPLADLIWSELRGHFGCPIGVSLGPNQALIFQPVAGSRCSSAELAAYLRERGYRTFECANTSVMVRDPIAH